VSARRKRRRERKRRRQDGTAGPRSAGSANELRETDDVERIAYSRRQAAEALGVSISTIDRRVVPAVNTVKTPWGQRLIPIAELDRLVQENIEAGRSRPRRQPAGRPLSLPGLVVTRIRLEHVRGRSLGEIARTLNAEKIPTGHGGRQWWASTVRSVLLREARE